MSKSFKLGRTNQCAKCPWKVSADPNEIPHGYSCDLHQNLAGTIAEPGAAGLLGGELRAMACHESPAAKPQYCVGWLINQLQNNNLALRLKMMNCENIRAVKLDGPQHERFEDTLPKKKLSRSATGRR